MAQEFRDLAGKAAKAVAQQARQRGVFLSLSDEEIGAFVSGVLEPGERLEVFADLRPHPDCPKVPRRSRVQDGFGGRSSARKMAGAAVSIAAFAAGEWEPDSRALFSTALHGGMDSLAGRLRVQYDPETSGCEHVLAVTDTRLMLVRIRSGVGRRLGPSLVPWWVRHDQVPACRRYDEGDFALGFADSSWIRLRGGLARRGEAVRACFPDVPGPWPGDR
ncbi:hypothetical protein [Actinocorallia populi]|uniref:hypothetical protein n=1 Tax=Actinocorallia populi TaxID=2079200 RepID=UPI000D09565F|nr:hypothetical protein [Actinocorallia populi]